MHKINKTYSALSLKGGALTLILKYSLGVEVEMKTLTRDSKRIPMFSILNTLFHFPLIKAFSRLATP